MNYTLGRRVSLEVRRHLARCKRCLRKMATMDEKLFIESCESRERNNFEATHHRK